jgi:hypothetical protein
MERMVARLLEVETLDAPALAALLEADGAGRAVPTTH